MLHRSNAEAITRLSEIEPSILIVDDDPSLCCLLRSYLEREGFVVIAVHSGRCAMETLRQSRDRVSLVLLDVMMPDQDGLATLRQLRTMSRVPIIMLSGRREPADRILGLELGADDYLGKPFLPAELVARIRAKLRKPTPPPQPAIKVGELRIDPMARRAFVRDQDLRLTAAEFSMLLTLASRVGVAVARENLRPTALCGTSDKFDRSIDVHVSRLRSKLAAASLGAPRIVNVRSVGYALQNPTESLPEQIGSVAQNIA